MRAGVVIAAVSVALMVVARQLGRFPQYDEIATGLGILAIASLVTGLAVSSVPTLIRRRGAANQANRAGLIVLALLASVCLVGAAGLLWVAVEHMRTGHAGVAFIPLGCGLLLCVLAWYLWRTGQAG